MYDLQLTGFERFCSWLKGNSLQPDGFSKPIFQATSSVLSNDPPSAAGRLNLLSVVGPLSYNASPSLFEPIQRSWCVGDRQTTI